ncbi:MAG: RMD1 family protein [Roseomonas sp.]|nr:RMD1 family protein [Roseomonas sp.]
MQEAPRTIETSGLGQTHATQGPLLRARAVILGERLDHRSLGPGGTAMADPVPIAAPAPITAFAFRWGAVVMFGANPAEEASLLAALAPRITNPADSLAEETALITLGAERDGVDAEGVIRLCNSAPERLAVVADALAKSAALAQQEARIAGALDRLEPAVADLRAAGRLRFSSRALHRQIGHALSAHSRNLARVEAADKPEVLWDHPELERLHARLADEYELSERGAALERKLAWIGDTIQTLLSLLQARRALGLEAAVVALVGIEVAFTLYEHVIRPLWH